LLRAVDDSGYLLGCDPHSLPVERVFHAYDHRARRGVELVGEELAPGLEGLIAELADCRRDRLGALTLAELIAQRTAKGPETDGLPSPGSPSTLPASRSVGQ
jgi:hypothetical protein